MKSDLRKWAEKNCDFTIMGMAYMEAGRRQSILPYTENILILADFLDSAYYADFVSYCIASRVIDKIIICGNEYGRYMIPFLKKDFPKVAIVEIGIPEISDESMAELLYKLYRSAPDNAHKVDIMEKQKYTFIGKTITSENPDIKVICAALRQCEEILSRHEEVVNNDWEWLQSLEERVTTLKNTQKVNKI